MLKLLEAIVGALQFLKSGAKAIQEPLGALTGVLLFLATGALFVGLTRGIAKKVSSAGSNKDRIE